ncbi:MAG: DoxX family protein [Elusimicrobia bacterium]|nr:DoxX family protein [Elusimicrobiota bacterium]
MNDEAAAAARTLVALVLLFAGVHASFAAPEEFAAIVQKYLILPPGALLPFARALPVVEVLVGLSLLLGWRVKWTAAAAMGLFAMFIAALGSTLVRHIDLSDCGCFGGAIHLKPQWTICLDAALLLMSYAARRRASGYAWLDAWIGRGS